MIVIKLSGGLGNQLFQYAFGLFLKKNVLKNEELFFQFYNSEKDTKRNLKLNQYQLDNFQLLGSSINLFPFSRFKKFQLLVFKRNSYFLEGYNFNLKKISKEISINSDLLFDGYWQNVCFVQAVEDELLKQLVLKKDICLNASQIRDLIFSSKNTIAVHVRKTDYIKNVINQNIYADCTIDYYLNSLEYIKNLIGDEINLFIFSDDFDWVDNHLNFDFPFYKVKNNSDFEDLYLMSLCEVIITANSTFSWWAGWLNTRKNKIIIAPKKWFVNGRSDKDLIPNNWIRIPN